jgi:hypothetical protein
MRNRLFLFALLLAPILQSALARSQQLTIQDETGKQTSLARAEVEALPHIKVTTSTSGEPATFEGVTLKAESGS